MKVTNIDLYCSCNNHLINLSFRDPTSTNSYVAKALSGIDSGDITAKFYGLGSSSNSKFYTMSLDKRELVIRISLNPKYSAGETITTLRDRLYRGISSSRTGAIDVQFKDGNSVVAAVKGLVTKLEANHFSDTPEVQLTMDCVDPMLTSPDFTYPQTDFASPNTPVIIDDVSTAPHGFEFEVVFNGPTPFFKIQDEAYDWKFEVMPGDVFGIIGFQNLDVLKFSSVNNKRHLYMNREGQTIHLLDRLKSDSVWPIIFPGTNEFYITADNFSWNYIRHHHTYWGL